MRFFLIDGITDWQPGLSAEAIKNVALSEDFFDDHFPRRPVMPGVLIVEGLAQLGGLLLEATLREKYGTDAKAIMTLLERTRFRELVRPGDSMTYHTEIAGVTEQGGKVRAEARRDGQTVVTTAILFAFQYVEDPMLERKRRELMAVWMGTGGQ